MKRLFNLIFKTEILYKLFRKMLLVLALATVNLIFAFLSLVLFEEKASIFGLIISIVYVLLPIVIISIATASVGKRNKYPKKIVFYFEIATYIIGFLAILFTRFSGKNTWIDALGYPLSIVNAVFLINLLFTAWRRRTIQRMSEAYTEHEDDDDQYVKPHMEYNEKKTTTEIDESKVVEVDSRDK